MSETAPNYAELTGQSNPELNGKVTFHLPTVLEQIRIDARIAQLTAPAAFDALPSDARGRVRVLATLELLIDTAPKGFYRTNAAGAPELALSSLPITDEAVLYEIYMAYMTHYQSFREGSRSAAGNQG